MWRTFPGTHEAYRQACLERARFLEKKLVSSICWGPKESTWITYIMTFQEVLVSNVANHFTVSQSLPDFTTNYQPGADRIWYNFNFQIHGLLLGINFIFYLLQDGCTSCLSFIKSINSFPCRIVIFSFAMRRLFELTRRLFHLGGGYIM